MDESQTFEQDLGKLQWRRSHVQTIVLNLYVELNSDVLKKLMDKPTRVQFHFLFGGSTLLWKKGYIFFKVQ